MILFSKQISYTVELCFICQGQSKCEQFFCFLIFAASSEKEPVIREIYKFMEKTKVYKITKVCKIFSLPHFKK